ncbi:hypothetical protein [Brucella oryzae]|nr:hypothetical protein [Brucella oryzae]
MEGGICHVYVRALNGINTDDGLVFDTGPATVAGIRTGERKRRSVRAG